MSPWLVFRLLRSFNLHLIILIVKAHDLLSNWGSPPVGLLVSEVKHSLASWASTIIHDWLSQHSHKCWLTRIHIPDNCYPSIVVLSAPQTWLYVVKLLKEFLRIFTFLNLIRGLKFCFFHLTCDCFYLLLHVKWGLCIRIGVLIWFLWINVLRISAKPYSMLVLNLVKHVLQRFSASCTFALWSHLLLFFGISLIF